MREIERGRRRRRRRGRGRGRPTHLLNLPPPLLQNTIQATGVANAHFGILKNGTFAVGYFSRDMVESGTFAELVGG